MQKIRYQRLDYLQTASEFPCSALRVPNADSCRVPCSCRICACRCGMVFYSPEPEKEETTMLKSSLANAFLCSHVLTRVAPWHQLAPQPTLPCRTLRSSGEMHMHLTKSKLESIRYFLGWDASRAHARSKPQPGARCRKCQIQMKCHTAHAKSLHTSCSC